MKELKNVMSEYTSLQRRSRASRGSKLESDMSRETGDPWSQSVTLNASILFCHDPKFFEVFFKLRVSLESRVGKGSAIGSGLGRASICCIRGLVAMHGDRDPLKQSLRQKGLGAIQNLRIQKNSKRLGVGQRNLVS